MKKNKIVLLDGLSINPGDLSWGEMNTLGDFTDYGHSNQTQVIERTCDADILLVSKLTIDDEVMSACPKLKYIGCTATGYNNIDVQAAAARGIAVTNVPAYSTDAVAQHVFSFILELVNNVALHSQSVRSGKWAEQEHFCYWEKPLTLLAGKSIGIIGYGNIGRKVATIAEAFGMNVNIYSRDKAATLNSDFITLHCPMTSDNAGFVDKAFLNDVKNGAVLINTARGGLLNEQDVADALASGKLSAFCADVLSHEPPEADNPLISAPNSYITPHIAWAPKETRQAVIDIVTANFKDWLVGGKKNRVDLK